MSETLPEMMSPIEYVDWTLDFIFRPGIDSHQRWKELLHCVRVAPDTEHMWRAFNIGWGGCDAVPKSGVQAFIDILTKNRPLGTRFLNKMDQKFFDSLPSVVTIYRGASPSKRRGLAWTVDIEVAKIFAMGHRGITVRDGSVYKSIVKKSRIMTVITDRRESEMVINPKLLKIDKFLRISDA